MSRIKAGIIGFGNIGKSHAEAIRRLGYAEVKGIVSRDFTKAKGLADSFGIPRVYSDYRELINDPEIEVIHNCTPNHLHYPINLEVLRTGKPILSEKPLTNTSAESEELKKLAETKNVITSVNFVYRFFSVIQHLKGMIDAGELGKVYAIHGAYLQDWLFFDTDYNWRVEKEKAGPSRAIADIGSHWCDMAQYLLGNEIQEVMADLTTVIPVRKKAIEDGFSTLTYENIEVSTEDFGSVLLRFKNGSKGCFTVSQVSAGRKSEFSFEINGSKASAYWNQEHPHELWLGYRNQSNQILISHPGLLNDYAKPGMKGERWPDAQKSMIDNYYQVLMGKDIRRKFSTFQDAHQIMQVIDAIIKSHQLGSWEKV